MSLDVALKNHEIWCDELDRDGASWYWRKHSFYEDSEVLIKRLENFWSTDRKSLSDTLDDYRSKMSVQEMYDELCLQVEEGSVEELLENSIDNPLRENINSRSGKEL